MLARTFKHSVILMLILGLLLMAQQYLMPGIIPEHAAKATATQPMLTSTVINNTDGALHTVAAGAAR